MIGLDDSSSSLKEPSFVPLMDFNLALVIVSGTLKSSVHLLNWLGVISMQETIL